MAEVACFTSVNEPKPCLHKRDEGRLVRLKRSALAQRDDAAVLRGPLLNQPFGIVDQNTGPGGRSPLVAGPGIDNTGILADRITRSAVDPSSALFQETLALEVNDD